MKRILFLSSALLSFTFFYIINNTNVAYAETISSWQKGASVNSDYSSNDFTSSQFQQSLLNLKQTGATYVSLVSTYYQDDTNTTYIHPGWNTPTDSSLASGIDYAHSIGLSVMIKLHVDLSNGSTWRAYINPGDKSGWFNSYTAILDRYAQIAQSHHAEEICIGTELISLTSTYVDSNNTQYWLNLIGNLRGIYSGKLLYDANPGLNGFNDEADNIGFWNQLDYIGLSAYFDYITHQPDASVQQLMNGWQNWDYNFVTPLHNKYNKPVIFAEIGYKSVNGANTQPWNYNLGGSPDQTEQANDYQAAMQYWSSASWMTGIYWWEWDMNPNAGGQNDTNYTPQNKLAQGVMTQWFTGGSSDYSPPSFTINSTRINPNIPANNQPITITSVVSNSGAASNELVVDMEIYNSSNNKVYQQSFNNESFNANSSNTYNITWTPNNADIYRVEVGVFNNNWSTNYLWNSNALSFTVNNASYIFSTYNISINPTNPVDNQQSSVAVSIQNTGTVLSNGIVDFEIWNTSNNSRAYQQIYNNQNISNKQSQNYSFNWTPNSTGTYRIKIGVFNNNWGINYLWNGNVLNFNVTNSSPTPTPTPTPITTPNPTPTTVVTPIPTPLPSPTTTPTPSPVDSDYTISNWWPINSSNLSGVQPFKAVINNLSILSYNMYWQVDNGQLNAMSNSITDAPHKEALVDTSSWNWRVNGHYNITFVAKDLNNNIISQDSIQVNIPH